MLKTESAALVLVDIQGKLATLMHDREALVRNLTIVTKGAAKLGLPIFWNEQVPEKLGPTVPELVEILQPLGLQPMAKKSFSCGGNPEFAEALAAGGRKQILLAGIESHVCVWQTARDLLGEGFDVYAVADAISSRTPENRRAGLDRMKDEGAKIVSTELALFELLRVAEGDVFREVSRLVR